jgi:hypothetical protein
MEVHDLIYHHIFFTTNCWWSQQMISHYFQLPTPQTLALVATATHCELSEYGSEMKATGMCTQDESQGEFCPPHRINFAPEATALINHTSLGPIQPPPTHHVAHLRRICVSHCLLALHKLDSLSSISFCSQFLLLQ